MGILKDKKGFLLFLLPGLLFYLFAVFYPIWDSIVLSLMKWGGIGERVFIGFDNYAAMFQDKIFYTAMLNTLVYLVIVVVMQLGIGMAFAVLLTSLTKGATLVKTLFYIPCIITAVAVVQMFRSIYATEPEGLLNMILNAVGAGELATSWLTNVDTVLAAVSVPEGWRFTGMYMVIYYSALISLDQEISEAARIDGATGWKLFWRIKLPMIRPVILLTLTMCLTGALRGFDIPFLLTGGGPGNLSELMSTYMYKKAFSSNQYGYGSALAVFIILESVLVVYLLRRFSASKEEREERVRSRAMKKKVKKHA